MIKKSPKKRVFFFDESRFGTHSKIGHAWLERGKRTAMPVKLGFKNFYLYSAVDPKTGEHFTLEIPYVNTESLSVFLEHFSKECSNDKCLLIMDGASWHKSKDLRVPKNIKIIYLPPYSPELNPTERLWEHIKRHTIKNKIYQTIESLKNCVGDFLNDLNSETIRSLCEFNYLYN